MEAFLISSGAIKITRSVTSPRVVQAARMP